MAEEDASPRVVGVYRRRAETAHEHVRAATADRAMAIGRRATQRVAMAARCAKLRERHAGRRSADSVPGTLEHELDLEGGPGAVEA